MINVEIIQAALLLVAALYFILKSSFYMIETKTILLFFPGFVFGLVYCFQASLFYFGDLALTIRVQDLLALGVYSFYSYLFIKGGHHAH